jgi:hypothetical protein
VDWPAVWKVVGGFFMTLGASLGATLGIGSGIGLIKLVRYMPAPRVNHKWLGAVYDTLQDLVSNMARVGERVDKTGETVFVTHAKVSATGINAPLTETVKEIPTHADTR